MTAPRSEIFLQTCIDSIRLNMTMLVEFNVGIKARKGRKVRGGIWKEKLCAWCHMSKCVCQLCEGCSMPLVGGCPGTHCKSDCWFSAQWCHMTTTTEAMVNDIVNIVDYRGALVK